MNSATTSSAPAPAPAPVPDPDSFVGSQVKVVMTSGIVATGTVAQVNPGSPSAALTLHDVSASFNGSTTHVAAVDIPGPTIKDLTIIKAAAKPSSPADVVVEPPPPSMPFIDPAILSFTPMVVVPTSLHPHTPPIGSPTPSASHGAPTRQFTIPTPTSSTNGGSHRPRPPVETCEEDGSSSSSSSSSSANDAHTRRSRLSATNGSGSATSQHNHKPGHTKHHGHPAASKHAQNHGQRRNHQQGHHHRNGNGPRANQQQHQQQNQDTWDLGDISDYHAHEFDFQAGLSRFDKQSVFDEIRKTDTVAPEDRLVSINRRAPPAIAKLKHTEMVLAPASPPPSSHASASRAPSLPRSSRRASLAPVTTATPRLRTLYGVPLPCATPLQTLDAHRLCGLSDVVLTENAGRSIAMMVLQALGGNRRFASANANGAPHVVLLCGRNGTGTMSRVAARHLRNRGVRCSVVQAGKHVPDNEGEGVYASADDVPRELPVDLIVDGLMGFDSVRDFGAHADRMRMCDLMAWANTARAPVLSVDVPSGVDAVSGRVTFPPHRVRPNWTLCIGIPKAGVLDRRVTGEVYLADMGMPAEVWARVGVVGWPDEERGWRVWEDKFVVGLEYVDDVKH